MKPQILRDNGIVPTAPAAMAAPVGAPSPEAARHPVRMDRLPRVDGSDPDHVVRALVAGLRLADFTEAADGSSTHAALADVLHCEPEEMILFPSRADAVDALVATLVPPASAVICQEPYDGRPDLAAAARGAQVRHWTPRAGTFHYDPMDLSRQLSTAAGALVVLHDPHPVLGTNLGDIPLVAVVTAATITTSTLVVDETLDCYRGYSSHALLRGRGGVVRIGSLSEPLGLRGAPLAYAIGEPRLLDAIRAHHRGGAVAAATVAVVGETYPRWIGHLAAGRRRLFPGWVAHVSEIRRCLPSSRVLGGRPLFVTLDLASRDRAGRLARFLASRGIVVKTFSSYPSFSS
ncbi:MAG: aminotransferase class I/II-fold pyridoxal phosphate-dependent enzyme, partial [Frankia sp.]